MTFQTLITWVYHPPPPQFLRKSAMDPLEGRIPELGEEAPPLPPDSCTTNICIFFIESAMDPLEGSVPELGAEAPPLPPDSYTTNGLQNVSADL